MKRATLAEKLLRRLDDKIAALKMAREELLEEIEAATKQKTNGRQAATEKSDS
jgi:prefoldin subunit 5